MNKDIIECGKKKLTDNHLDLNLSDYLLKYGDENKYLENIERLINNEPVQYIVGSVNFYGYNFYIDKNVLIPRFETEELIYYTKEYINQLNFDNLHILDIGTGSGCISITLKKEYPEAVVTAIDISKSALDVAKRNANENNVDINFYQGDMLRPVLNNQEKYNIIISNPPYITEYEDIEEIVLKSEPHLALFGGKDGLKYYKQILKDCNNILHDKFLIAFEIGYNQANPIKEIAKTYFPNAQIIIKKDMTEKDRFVFIKNR